MKYELWVRSEIGHRTSEPVAKFATLDAGIYEAQKISKEYFDEVYVIIEKSVPKPIIRGFGRNGKWNYACECKRCNGSYWESDNCVSCKGNGWKYPG